MSEKSNIKPEFKMTEVYNGKAKGWKGWYKFFLYLGGPGHDKTLACPLEPETSNQILSILSEIEKLKKENEEAFKKGFWAGFEDARCFPEETNILNRYNKLTKENKQMTLENDLDDNIDDHVVETFGGVDKTLNERGQRYGSFKTHAEITQNIKSVMQNSPNWLKLSTDKIECLDMIAHKIGRILNGDPEYVDSWHDIAGYATLVEKELNNKD